MQEGSSFYKVAFYTLIVLLLLAVATYFAYQFGKGSLKVPPQVFVTATPYATEATLEPVETATPVAVSDDAAIKEAVYKKTGLTSEKAEVTISTNTGTHAKGGIKEYDAVGGAYWIAAKVADGWVAVYDGQTTPECTLIEPYNFPKDMVPQCLNVSGEVVNR
jgi:hypothetical protein